MLPNICIELKNSKELKRLLKKVDKLFERSNIGNLNTYSYPLIVSIKDEVLYLFNKTEYLVSFKIAIRLITEETKRLNKLSYEEYVFKYTHGEFYKDINRGQNHDSGYLC